jgi:hypothetical protein
MDPLSRADRNLKAADKYFDLARTASIPFMRAYYQRIAERYLSSEREFSTTEYSRTRAAAMAGSSDILRSPASPRS